MSLGHGLFFRCFVIRAMQQSFIAAALGGVFFSSVKLIAAEPAAATKPAAANSAAAKPAALFDGKTLAGWEGDETIFAVRDGAIVGGTLKTELKQNAFLATTKEYKNFELSLKFKLVGGDHANAGVQFRSRRIPKHHEMIGYQADLGNNYWGALYDESRRNKVLIAPQEAEVLKVLKKDDWNVYRIRCEGRHIQLWLNGLQTVDYNEPDEKIEQTGLIAVQVHSGPPTEAWYKDIELTELP